MKDYKINIKRAGLIQKSGGAVAVKSTIDIVTAQTPWDAAHKYLDKTDLSSETIEFIEPEIDNTIFSNRNEQELVLKSGADGYLESWPRPPQGADSFVWHLGEKFSQLAKARDTVWEKLKTEKCIRIAHVDTGYQEGHPSLPKNLQTGISFIDDERGQPAIDNKRGTMAEQEGHGTATMSLLAGREVLKESTGGKYEGFFGAIPFAEILPIRICDTVALIRSNSFVNAIEYAIAQKCEVLSMSMAGAPTRDWADAVNKAYEAGLVLVTAAGNSFTKGFARALPKRVLYPARWERVIAATGVAADQNPYIFGAPRLTLKSAGGETMQGNYGPPSAMKNALAAYTPNTTWATMGDSGNGIYFSLDGGGTSSATPQVAAAAALWICYNREKLNALVGTNPGDQWKRVEAVKFGLFNSANRDYKEWETYYGRGVLKAFDALETFPAEDDLKKANEAKVGLNGFLDLFGLLLRLKDKKRDEQEIRNEMYVTEFIQAAHNDPSLHFLLDYDEDKIWSEADKQRAIEIIENSQQVSSALKEKVRSLQQIEHE
jgi:hypothetical protein